MILVILEYLWIVCDIHINIIIYFIEKYMYNI